MPQIVGMNLVGAELLPGDLLGLDERPDRVAVADHRHAVVPPDLGEPFLGIATRAVGHEQHHRRGLLWLLKDLPDQSLNGFR
jgi:hypothetical protein